MEIDKVVEAAKAVVNSREDSRGLKHMDKCINELYIALNPPPARPSKEECIDWLNRYFTDGEVTEDSASMYKATISYLKEPSLQWVKNTGVRPEYKAAIGRLDDGALKLLKRHYNRLWGLDDKYQRVITEYIILE